MHGRGETGWIFKNCLNAIARQMRKERGSSGALATVFKTDKIPSYSYLGNYESQDWLKTENSTTKSEWHFYEQGRQGYFYASEKSLWSTVSSAWEWPGSHMSSRKAGEQHIGTPHWKASQRSSQWITKFKPQGLIGGGNRFGFRKKQKNENWVKTKGSMLFGHKVSPGNKMIKAPMRSLVAHLERARAFLKFKFPGKGLCYIQHFRSEGHSWVHFKFQGMLRYPNPAQDVRRHF